MVLISPWNVKMAISNAPVVMCRDGADPEIGEFNRVWTLDCYYLRRPFCAHTPMALKCALQGLFSSSWLVI